MNRILTHATISAAAFAGAATLWLVWLESRRRYRKHSARELRTQLKTWEGEGGNIAPPAPAESADAR